MTDWKFVFYLHFTQLQTSNSQFLQLRCINKNEKNRCCCCFCYCVLPPCIRQISRSYFLKQDWRFFLHCLSLKYVVTDHFWWSNVPVDQNKLKSSSFWSNSHMASMFETLFSLYIYVHPAKQWVKSFFHTTDHLQQFRADKFSTFFKSKLSLDVLVG